jgi:hypothetical protein
MRVFEASFKLQVVDLRQNERYKRVFTENCSYVEKFRAGLAGHIG